MLKRFLSSFGGAGGVATTSSERSAPVSAAIPVIREPRGPSAPVYPPVDAGIMPCSVEEIIESQADLMRRLRLATGLRHDEFDHLYGSVIRALAEECNLLPASESGTHCGAGGLFRLALEVGFFSLQTSEASIFAARAGVESRRVLEPRWRYATWLAGICCELYRPVTDMVVSSDSGEHWPAYTHALTTWVMQRGHARYFVRWVDKSPMKARPGRGAAATLSQRIIPPYAMQYLHEGSTEIAPTMLDVITGSIPPGAICPMAKIVTDVRDKVFARDAATRPQNYGRMTVGQHMEPHLLDAMRRLVKDGTWQVNQHKSRIWFGDEGLFLVWTTAVKEILRVLEADGVSGVPKDPQTILEVLIDAGVFEAHRDGSPYWTIYSPRTGAELATVKFTNSMTIFGATLDEPESAGLLTRKADAKADDDSTTVAGERSPGASSEQTGVEQEGNSGNTTQPASEDTGTPNAQAKPEGAPEESKGTTGSGREQPPKTKPKAGPVEPVAENNVAGLVPEDLAKSVDPLVRDVLGALIDDMRAGRIINQAGKTKQGFAIGLEQIVTYGVDVARFAAALQKAGWLYTDPEKPNRKIVETQINGALQRAVVIQMPVAVDLGLVL